MAVRIELKNSNVADKRPTADQISNYELALNYNAEGPFLCCKDSDGNIQQVGGVKLSEDAPGSPVKQTMWVQPSTQKLFIFDGDRWIDFGSGGGGGGSGAVDQILAGDGLNSSPASGVGTITLETDIDQSKGLEYVSGSLAVAAGSGLQFDPDGNLEVTAQPLVYKGTLDLTSDDAKPSPVSTGDTWANVEAGTSDAVWNPDIPTGASVSVGDLVAYDGTKWTLIPVGTPTSGRTDLGVDNKTAFAFDVTSSTGSNVTLPAATDSEAGLMTAGDKNSVDNGWQRISGTLSPINAGDDVLIGGVLPDAPNLSLSSTGSVVQKGSLLISRSGGGSGAPFIRMENDGTRYAELAIDGFYLGGTISNRTANISLNTNGNATFLGDVDSGTQNLNTSSAAGAKIFSQGAFQAQRPSDNANSIYIGYQGKTRTVDIKADGNATFNGDIVSGSNPALSTSNEGIVLRSRGTVTVNRPDALAIWAGYQTGTPGVTSVINADGSTQFSGNIAVNRTSANETYIYGTINGTATASLTGEKFMLGGVIPSAPAITLGSDGTGSFATGRSNITTQGTINTNAANGDVLTLKRDGDLGNVGVVYGVSTNGVRAGLGSPGRFSIGPVGSNLVTSAVIELNGIDGSATFNGLLKAGTIRPLNPDSAAAPGLCVYNEPDTGFFRPAANTIGISAGGIERARFNSVGDFYLGGVLPSAPAIELNADGDGAFNGSVSAGTVSTGSAAVTGARLNSEGYITAQRPDTAGSGQQLFQGFTGTNKVFNVSAAGKGQFAGTVEIGGSSGAVASPSILLKDDGSASFGGNVQVGTFTPSATDVSGAAISPAGLMNIQRTAGTAATSPLYAGWLGADRTFFVSSDGGIKIAGTTGNSTNPTISLAASGDAQFVGSVAIGGTAADNTIDEYETGTFSFELRNYGGSAVTYPVTIPRANYTKVGNVVNIQIYFKPADDSLQGTPFLIAGVPFTNGSKTYSTIQVVNSGSQICSTQGYITSGSAVVREPLTNVSAGDGIYINMTFNN